MSNSAEMELGRCGEAYAAFKLLKQGFVCFQTDQGMAYDLVVDVDGHLLRGQVKTTFAAAEFGRSGIVYRWNTRSGRVCSRAGAYLQRSASPDRCDFYALVCVQDEKIAFVATSELLSKTNEGKLVQTVEMRSQALLGRITSRTIGTRMTEDFEDFNRVITLIKGNQ